MELVPFITCECGKLHATTYITVTSLCTCGVNLWQRAWNAPEFKKEDK